MFTLKSILICSQTWCSSCNHPHNANRFSKTTKPYSEQKDSNRFIFCDCKKKRKERKKKRKKEIQIMGGFQIGWFSWVVNIVCLTVERQYMRLLTGTECLREGSFAQKWNSDVVYSLWYCFKSVWFEHKCPNQPDYSNCRAFPTNEKKCCYVQVLGRIKDVEYCHAKYVLY